MKQVKSIAVFAVVLVLCLGVTTHAAEKPPAFKFGTIPVLQSLPLFVAAEKGFFKEQGLNVDIVLFNSAMEKDIAFTSGQIAGYFGDIMTPTVLVANGTKIRMVAVNYNTTADRRMFAVLASPKAKEADPASVARAGIATGSNTIAEYLIIRLLAEKKVPRESIKLVDIKSIPSVSRCSFRDR
jgi:NitT/TauT family transport system substrate-binding protein